MIGKAKFYKGFQLTALLLLFVFAVHAQKVAFTVTTEKTSYYESEPINLVYSIKNAVPKDLEVPQLADFDIVGQSNGSSTNISVINGKRVQNIERTITFQLKAKRKGRLKIPSAQFTFENKVYKSNQFYIEVKSVNLSDAQLSKDRFVKVELSKSNPYVGESITLKYTLFTVDQIESGNEIKSTASFQNFGAFTSKELSKFQASSLVVDGKRFLVLELQKHLLLPVRPGKVTIPSFDFEYISYQYQGRGFFRQRVGKVDHKVIAPSVVINVKELPQSPAGFSGLVGRFELKRNIDKRELPVDDALTVKYEIVGKGNFSTLQTLDCQWGTAWEVFDPKRIEKVKGDENGYQGKLGFEYVAIPRRNGKQEVPGLSLSYFDLNSKSYVTLSADPQAIDVTGVSSTTSSVVPGVKNQKQAVQLEGEDIRYLKTDYHFDKLSIDETNSMTLPGVLGGGVTLLSLFILLLYHPKEESEASVNDRKRKNANKKADKVLAAATLIIDNDQLFYAKIQESLHQFLLDKLTISTGELTVPILAEKLKDITDDEAKIQEVLHVYESCAMARYSPIGVSKGELLERVKKVIVSLG